MANGTTGEKKKVAWGLDSLKERVLGFGSKKISLKEDEMDTIEKTEQEFEKPDPKRFEKFMGKFATDFESSGVATDLIDELKKLQEANEKLLEENKLQRAKNRVMSAELDYEKQRNNKLYFRTREQKKQIRQMNKKMYTLSLEQKVKKVQKALNP